MTASQRSQCAGALMCLALVLVACGAGPGGASPAATISAHTDADLPTPKAPAATAGRPVFIEFFANW